jgi:hypothetical protein
MDISGAVAGLKNSVRDMAVRIIRQEAPELTDAQAAELMAAWIPEPGVAGPGAAAASPKGAARAAVPGDLLRSMIHQFVAFSQGAMDE